MFTHILPNLAAPLTTLAVLEFARIILAEAALSFLGVGVKRTDISWGLDVATGQDFIFSAWWLVTMPGLLISLTVLSVNLVASWLRIVADPAEREKRYAATRKLPKLARMAAPPTARANLATASAVSAAGVTGLGPGASDGDG
jgi:hypothetical protein